MPALSPTTAPHDWLHHLEDEADAAYLYRNLASLEEDPARAELYARLAGVEDRHVSLWQQLLRDHGHQLPKLKPTLRARTMALLARRFGPGFLAPMLLEEEGREVKSYLSMYRQAPEGAAGAALGVPY